MAATTILWAGKAMSTDEEIRLRRLVHTLRRIGNDELAEDFERFAPENADAWTPNELEAGAQVGPWLRLDAGVEDDGRSPMRDTA